MPSLSYYITQKEKLYDITEDLQAEMRSLSKEISDIVVTEYARFFGKVENVSLKDKVTFLSGETAKIEELIISKLLSNSTYKKTIEKYIQSFEKIAELNKKIHYDINKINAADIIKYSTRSQRDKINSVVSALISRDELSSKLIQPVKNLISSNIMAGTTLSDAKQYLKDYISGNNEKLGYFERYAGQISRDAIFQYDGEINNVIMREYNMYKIQYVGSIVKDSRAQCIRWVNEKKGVLMYDELEKEISWAYRNGSGMIQGTTPENFLIFRGGYNCRHEAIPIL